MKVHSESVSGLTRRRAWLGRAWLPAVRLAVPGPVWGERPMRVEGHAVTDSTRTAQRRGPLSGTLIEWVRRGARVDARSLAQQALCQAAQPCSLLQWTYSAAAIRMRLVREGLHPDTLVAALGLVGAALVRTTGCVPRLNQYECACLLLTQRLVELDTGEGKSVALALAAAVAAWTGAPVHVLTANGYLAQRDAAEFAGFYAALHVSVAAVVDHDSDDQRRAGWRADVAYASARTLGFDYLRDVSRLSHEPWLSRGLCVALVDEADSVLVDEARTPLILAEPVQDAQARACAWRALDWARRLQAGHHVNAPSKGLRVHLTPAGQAQVAEWVADEGAGVTFQGVRHRTEWIEQAWVALHHLKRDVDYLVKDREIVLIDAATGRPDGGRRLGRALHAMVAIKEGVPVPPATQVRASMTYPRLFARYHHMCGTSGTLAEAAAELRRYYGLTVVRVSRMRPSRLRLQPMQLFVDRDAQFAAAVARAQTMVARGRCVLVATDSVADSQALAQCFAQRGVPVAVLDARHDGAEHAQVARAGAAGQITVSTQMAGRGTDIRLSARAAQSGGLHVLSLQHNRSRRIDRQVAGRAARQGDPGSAEHWLRWQDSPLHPTQVPAGLRMLADLLGRWILAHPQGRVRRWVLKRLWGSYQWVWRWEDAWLRLGSLSHDRHWSRRLHFATIRSTDE